MQNNELSVTQSLGRFVFGSHRGRSGHVAEEIEVVDILQGEPRDEMRERNKASDTSRQGDLHSHETLNSASDRVGGFAWVGRRGEGNLFTGAVCAAEGKKQLSPRFIIRKWI